jgi:hypothetical protein
MIGGADRAFRGFDRRDRVLANDNVEMHEVASGKRMARRSFAAAAGFAAGRATS